MRGMSGSGQTDVVTGAAFVSMFTRGPFQHTRGPSQYTCGPFKRVIGLDMRGASYSGQTGVVTGATSVFLKALGILGLGLAAAGHAFDAPPRLGRHA